MSQNGLSKIVTVKVFEIFVQQAIGVKWYPFSMYGTCSKDYFDIQYIMKSNIDYEKCVLEVKFEEFDIDEVRHIEESYIYRQSSVYIGICK